MTRLLCSRCRQVFDVRGHDPGARYHCPDCPDGWLEPVEPARAARPRPRDPEPERVGAVRILERIGAGGMGVVYRGVHEPTGRVVAVKMLSAQGAADKRLVSRLKREVRAASKLRHPGIVSLHESGDHAGVPYYVMDYVDGLELAEHLAEHEVPLRRRIELLVAAAHAVEHAHRHGIVHRDLKPDNLMVDVEGQMRLLDFGLAKDLDVESGVLSAVSVEGELLGTPAFMSPEQGVGEPVDYRSDVYALGAILYWMLTGSPPHEGNTPLQLVYRVVNEEPRDPRAIDPSVPAELAAIALHALEKYPGDRHPSAAALAGALEAWLAES